MPSVPVRQQYLFVIFFDTMHSEATEGVMHVWYLYFFGFEGCFGQRDPCLKKIYLGVGKFLKKNVFLEKSGLAISTSAHCQ